MFATYDGWKTATPDHYENGTAPQAMTCCVCKGGDLPPCSEDCADVARKAAAVADAKSYAQAANKALRLVRAFTAEGDGFDSPRIVATLARISELRRLRKAALDVARGRS